MPKIHLLPIIIFVVFSLLLIATATFFKKEPAAVENFFQGSKNILFDRENKGEKISQILNTAIATQGGRWAIYIKDLNRAKIYEVNSQAIFPSASLYKLAVMYKTYDELENGRLQKDASVSENKTELDITLQGLQDKENADGQKAQIISYNVFEALRLMITISDNYSALLLAKRLGWENIDRLMENEGFAQIDLISQDSPTVSAKAVGDLLERIYSNKAVNTQASEEMKKLLSGQKINDRIPKYLPQDVKIGHKTGELDGLRHDAGIVYGQNSNYIFVFLSDTPTPLEASETIALLSKQIFDVLEK